MLGFQPRPKRTFARSRQQGRRTSRLVLRAAGTTDGTAIRPGRRHDVWRDARPLVRCDVGNLAANEAALKQIVYVPIDGLLKTPSWIRLLGKNSAQMATITRQPRSAWRSMPEPGCLAGSNGGKRRDHALLGTRNRPTPDGAAGLGCTAGRADDSTHHPAAGRDGGPGQRTNAQSGVTQAQARVAPLQAAAAAADAKVAEAQQDLLDGSGTAAKASPATWRARHSRAAKTTAQPRPLQPQPMRK